MNPRLLTHLSGVWVLCIVSFTVQAELTVVADLGGQSTATYFDSINNQGEGTALQTAPSSAPVTPVIMGLPVSTPELTPGKVAARALSLAGMRPMFLVGDDDLSRRWLSLRRDALGQLNAVGLVVNVASEGALNDLKKHADGLELLPVSGSDLAKRLGLSHYPVLLTEKGLEQ
ncbi:MULTISPECIES: integrating conjugative element protein [Yersinia]|jgi:integrating conjugative element protein (TIGR03765 family)|uniref:integrating conjugative element protein n=1 Tax=Yersinia TaxID=629 RepID=UPI00065CFAA5|nr:MULTISPECIES: integrating conjugative element protein [Yersinia]UYK10045.1 integrating conjugative element protein [Yersinia enterocolitica]CRY82375.1 integrating conjugative element protein%2C PFL_4695 family [Yersinia intermedia]HDL7969639.1 integrating conjugative element protein [Yersinia enterocolitica]HDY4892081.1 integrating conjugative element protein [Yersinia enterocolitica]